MRKMFLIVLLFVFSASAFTAAYEIDKNFICWDDSVRQYDISYPDTDGTFPLLIVAHGFSGNKSTITQSGVKDRLTGYGFVVAALTTRKDAGGLEILDYPYLVEAIESEYGDRVNGKCYLVGYSGGGGNGYSVITKCPDLFNGVAMHFGMCDYGQWYNDSSVVHSTIAAFIGGTPATLPNAYAARNSLYMIGNNKKTKQFIMHDTGDVLVQIVQSDNWASAADGLGIDYSYTKTTEDSTTRALHGLPIVGTSGEPNIQFERTISPAWADTFLTLSNDVSIDDTGMLICGAFIKTDNFQIVTGNENRCIVHYNINPMEISIYNTDSTNALDTVYCKLKMFADIHYSYQINDTINYATSDSNGYLTFDFIMAEDDTVVIDSINPVYYPNTGCASLTFTNPDEVLEDFVFFIDLSIMPSEWKSAFTADTGGRVYKEDGTELPSFWYDVDHTTKTGYIKGKWTGTLDTALIQRVLITPPNADSTQYGIGDEYGRDSTFTGHICYYPLNGDATEKTGNGNTMTISGAVDTTGKVGHGYKFDGVNDYMVEGSIRIDSTLFQSGFTINMWLNPFTFGEANYGQAIAKCGNTAGLNGFVVGMHNAPKMYIRVNEGVLVVADGNSLPYETMSNMSITVDTGGVAIHYVNGVAAGSDTTEPASTITSGAPLLIGGFYGAYSFDGIIDEVQILSSVKTVGWVKEEYLQTSDNETFWGDVNWFDASATITTDPTNVSDSLGNDTLLYVTYTGTAPVAVQWWKAIDSIGPYSAVTDSTNDTLRLLNLTRSDSGWYRASVSNSFGSDTSAAAHVVVQWTALVIDSIRPNPNYRNDSCTIYLQAGRTGGTVRDVTTDSTLTPKSYLDTQIDFYTENWTRGWHGLEVENEFGLKDTEYVYIAIPRKVE